jgi:type I restriction enzyme S subunit
LGDVSDIQKGDLITGSIAVNGNIPVIGGGTSVSYYHNVPNRPPNTVTISASGANAGYVSFHEYPIFASDCSTIIPSKYYDVKFIYYLLKNNQTLITSLQTGGAQPHVYPEQLKPLEFAFPSIDEQRAIAAVLADMDAEIAALEARREKVRQVKQGMMQVLLTGKVRLVTPAIQNNVFPSSSSRSSNA